jgi:RHS repeat-associated protein
VSVRPASVPRRRRRRPPLPGLLVATFCAALAVAVLSPVAVVPALAAPAAVVPTAVPVDSTPVTEVPPALDPAVPAPPDATDKVDPQFPPAATGEATVPPANPAPVQVGTLPVYVSTPPAAAAKAAANRAAAADATAPKVRVGLYDQATTEDAEVHGLLLKVDRTDTGTTGADVDLAVDYRNFVTAYGADWASRLRVVSMPECALTTPDLDECAATTLESKNDVTTGRVKATVSLPAQGSGLRRSAAAAGGSGSLLAVSAGSSGASGNYSATSLSPSATWSAGGSNGDFTWSYPMRTPPGLNGPTPSMKLNYSAQSVDGRHAASNNQPSIVGEGFEFTPGDFIERRYTQCGLDMDSTDHNNKKKTGDLCWETDNATMSLAGGGGELIYNAGEKFWHLRRDDGTRVQRIAGGTDYGNGDNNGEYWKVTTVDGTQYFFGKNRLDGWTKDKPETNSVFTAPVFGNDPDEPCHADAFKDSDCTQAWRWNLDYVIDPNGNTMSMWYDVEKNRYARNMKITSSVEYIRGGTLNHVDYGTDNRTKVGGELTDSLYRGLKAPMRVDFKLADRCLANCAKHNEKNWPDTPWDQQCLKAKCLIAGPTFWSTKRLAQVTTRVLNGADYRDVERWKFTHTFPDPGDGTRAGLWLSRISHEGLVGTAVSTPDIEFTGVQLDNRVDTIDHSPAMKWWRIAKVRNESGGTVSVNYSPKECVAKTKVPTDPEKNTLRCYPVRWTPEGYSKPVIDYFHKYVVEKIYETDHTGGAPPNGSPRVAYKYDYIGAPAWHYADDDGLINKKDKTWSQWRGYARVGVTVGDEDDEESYSESTYFRGMDGDKLPSGHREVTIPGAGVPTVADQDAYAGLEREKISYNGKGGAEVARVVNEPWQSDVTASRTINGDTVESRFVDIGATHNRITLDAGRGVRVNTTRTTFDDYGMAVKVDESGDVAKTGDEKCVVNEYSRNTTAWIMNRPHTAGQYAKPCKDATKPAELTADDVIKIERTLYDGHELGVAPTAGLPTENQELSEWKAGVPTFVTTAKAGFDDYGRPDESWDAMNKRSTTAYNPTANAPVTSTVVTNPLLHTSTTELEPAWGQATATIDANTKRTSMTYDGLGRSRTVRKAGSTKDTVVFDYAINNNAPSVVTTSMLTPTGSYVTKRELYDGLLRLRQTQAPSPSGGRLLSDNFYDTAGREVKKYNNYYNSGKVGTSLVIATDRTDVPSQTRTVYDGTGRVTASIFQPYDTERNRTRTYYAGDRVDNIPPSGGTVTSAVGDANGRTVELREYHGTTPTGAYEATKYTYDPKGQLVRVQDPAGNAMSSVFDLRGREVETNDPDKGRTQFTYDNAGKVTTTTDSRNRKLLYTYDALGRKRGLYETAISGTGRAAWVYDTVAKGQLSQSTRYSDGNSYTVKITGYTDDNKPKGSVVEVPTGEIGLNGTYEYSSTFNDDGSVNTTSYPKTADLPTETLTNVYDTVTGAPKRLTTIYGTSEFSLVADTDYNALGQVDQVELYTGLFTGKGARVFQSFERELETGLLKGSRVDRELISPYTVSNQRYDYDDVGNVRKIADIAAEGGTDNQCFRNDYAGRLVEAWTPASGDCAPAPTTAALGGPAKYWLSWDIDAAGRRLKQVDHAAPTGAKTTDYHYAAANGSLLAHQLTGTTTTPAGGTPVEAAYSYDEAGNTKTRPAASGGGTQTLSWDAEGRLESVQDATGTTSYVYDADGNRIVSRDAKGKTLYLPGQEVRFDTKTAARSCIRYYSWSGQSIASRTVTALSWTLSDEQGTSNVTIDEKTQQSKVRRQTPYGETRGTAQAWPNSKGFVGGTMDGTGLVHLGAREYDPGLGRFVSVDPVLAADDPQQMNPYAYAGNSPIDRSDANGLSASGKWMRIGSEYGTWTQGGYEYHYLRTYYLFCRYGGAQCLGGYGNAVGWIDMRYAGVPGVWLVGRVTTAVWRFRLFIGPVVSSKPKPSKPLLYGPVAKCPSPQAQKPPAPEIGEMDGGRECSFFDFKCLFDGKGGAKAWWRTNRDWVTGGAAVIGFGACVFFTAGVCAVAGVAGLGVALTGRVLDVAASNSGWTKQNVARMGTGMAIDVASFKLIPGIRALKATQGGKSVGPVKNWLGLTGEKSVTLSEQFLTSSGKIDGAALKSAGGPAAAQTGWLALSTPGDYSAWQMGVPWTDPMAWG